jgi:hypothetical protein
MLICYSVLEGFPLDLPQTLEFILHMGCFTYAVAREACPIEHLTVAEVCPAWITRPCTPCKMLCTFE